MIRKFLVIERYGTGMLRLGASHSIETNVCPHLLTSYLSVERLLLAVLEALPLRGNVGTRMYLLVTTLGSPQSV